MKKSLSISASLLVLASGCIETQDHGGFRDAPGTDAWSAADDASAPQPDAPPGPDAGTDAFIPGDAHMPTGGVVFISGQSLVTVAPATLTVNLIPLRTTGSPGTDAATARVGDCARYAGSTDVGGVPPEMAETALSWWTVQVNGATVPLAFGRDGRSVTYSTAASATAGTVHAEYREPGHAPVVLDFPILASAPYLSAPRVAPYTPPLAGYYCTDCTSTWRFTASLPSADSRFYVLLSASGPVAPPIPFIVCNAGTGTIDVDSSLLFDARLPRGGVSSFRPFVTRPVSGESGGVRWSAAATLDMSDTTVSASP